MALGHLARAEREAGGDDGREALGDGGHRERDRDLEVVDRALELRAQVLLNYQFFYITDVNNL